MGFILEPWQLYFVILAGWINRQQQEVIEYLIEENRVPKKQLRGRCLRLTDEQRRGLAAKSEDGHVVVVVDLLEQRPVAALLRHAEDVPVRPAQ